MSDEQERQAQAPEAADDELAAAYRDLGERDDAADDWTRGMLW